MVRVSSGKIESSDKQTNKHIKNKTPLETLVHHCPLKEVEENGTVEGTKALAKLKPASTLD